MEQSKPDKNMFKWSNGSLESLDSLLEPIKSWN